MGLYNRVLSTTRRRRTQEVFGSAYEGRDGARSGASAVTDAHSVELGKKKSS